MVLINKPGSAGRDKGHENLMETLLSRSVHIMIDAHHGQRDQIGEFYSLHCLRVMMAGETYEEMIVGALHDVIEDTIVTLEMLMKEFPPEIIYALDAITHRYDINETNVDYFSRVKANALATPVKINDINDNWTPARFNLLPEDTQERLNKKYAWALVYLGVR